MNLTPHEAQLIRASYEKLLPRVAEASVSFYETLFDLAPELRALFRDDLAGQGMRFMSAIGVIVGHLDAPQLLDQRLQALGRSHAAFGLTETNYRAMEEALFITLREALGPDFTRATQEAWRIAFRHMTEAMIRAGTAATG
jgi:nitric oxide dioxygenase